MGHASPSLTAAERPRFEVGRIFATHGAAYRQSHTLGPEQRRAMWAIESCRTAVLGGHLEVCAECGKEEPAYNSCRNRHCPKCQNLAQDAWIRNRQKRILPTHYFHVVFTLPAELRALCRRNAAALYDLLFASASQTLLDFGRGELGAQLGLTTVLHTWTRDLKLHPHLHCVVTGGGLDVEANRWVPTSKQFLFPVKALATCFRGKFLDGLRKLRDSKDLQFGGSTGSLADPKVFGKLIDSLYRINWVVYAKRPFGGAEQVFEYLGRYTHRVAISNSRIVHADDEEIRFRTRDGNHASVTPEVFIGRFLLHVLPKRFVKIRHYGLMASGLATTRLEQARTLLESTAPVSTIPAPPPSPTEPPTPLDWRTQLKALTGRDPAVCPHCGGLRIRRPLPTRSPEPASSFSPHDTS